MSRSASKGLGALLFAGVVSANAAPGAGRYDARLCVILAEQQPSCGPAQAQLRSGGRVQVQVSDIEYRLRLKNQRAEVLLMHGTMQIDEFTTPYDWAGSVLRFRDADKKTSYEVHFSERLPTPK